MGQDISFEQIASGNDDTHIYSLNRSLTGMEIVTYDHKNMIVDENNGADVLAKLLLDVGVQTVSVYSNVVTIKSEKEKFETLQSKIEDILKNLFRYYGQEALWSKSATN